MGEPQATHAAAHEAHGDHAESFIRKYVFSTDHKVIGVQYGLTALVFLAVGFFLVLLMRWQLAYPEQPMPLLGGLFGNRMTDAGVMTPEFYTSWVPCTAPSWCFSA